MLYSYVGRLRFTYEKYVKIHTKNTDAGEKRSLLCFKAKGCPKGHGCR